LLPFLACEVSPGISAGSRAWAAQKGTTKASKKACGFSAKQADNRAMDADARFAELNLELPPAPKPVGVYKPMVIVGNLAYLSGHGPMRPDTSLITGKVGADLSLEEGKLAARQVGLSLIATLKAQLGSLNRVKRVIKVLGMVNGTPDFQEHPKVINGCSELFAAIWGQENGVGARSAVGMGSLPTNIAVEIEVIMELEG
jgi:enamine deaminase RidA (YjgF/YER057c/UK114 family)